MWNRVCRLLAQSSGSIRRWGQITLFAVAGAPFAVALDTIIRLSGILTQWHRYLSELTPVGIVVVMFLLLLLMSGIVLHIAPLKWAHLLRTARYPSIWISVPLGVLLSFTLQRWYYTALSPNGGGLFDATTWVMSIALMCVAGLVASGIAKLIEVCSSTSFPPVASTHRGSTMPAAASEAVKQWMAEERPLQDPREDLLGASRVSEKLVARLNNEAGISIYLQGEFGSGKSSIIEWMCQGLPPELWVCRVSAWDLGQSGALLQLILSKVVSELGNHVDVLAVSDLPSTYRQMLTEQPWWMRSWFSGYTSDHDPSTRVDRLRPILGSLDGRLLIILEDIDRAAPGLNETAQLQSLIQRLGMLPHVSIIVAGGSSNANRLEIAKIFDFVEPVPGLPVGEAWDVIRQFRAAASAEFPTDIDPADKDARDSFSIQNDAERFYFQELEIGDIGRAILRLVRTPRQLKFTLRRTWGAWLALHGEVDLDDLLLMNVLRCAAPPAFDFVSDNLIDLQRPGKQSQLREQGWQKQNVQTAWTNCITLSEFDRDASADIIGYLFHLPQDWTPFNGFESVSRGLKPQGVAAAAPRNYLARIMSEGIPHSDVRDQFVLKLIRDERLGINEGKLPHEMANNEETAVLWEYLYRVPERDQDYLLKLAQGVVGCLLQKHEGPVPGDCEALLAIWRKVGESPYEPEMQAVAWLVDRLRETIPQNLQLANDLYYYWASHNHGLHLSQSGRQEVRKHVVEIAENSFSANPRQLIASLSMSEHKYVVWHLVFPNDEDNRRADTSVVNSESWNWLGGTLLESLGVAPQAMYPYVANLILKHNDNPHKLLDPQFDVHVVAGLFGAAQKRLMEWLRENAAALPVVNSVTGNQVAMLAASSLRGAESTE